MDEYFCIVDFAGKVYYAKNPVYSRRADVTLLEWGESGMGQALNIHYVVRIQQITEEEYTNARS